MKTQLSFYGAAQTVTGSKFLLERNGFRILIDCGLYQGESSKELLERSPAFDPKTIDAVILTHAHLDHCGYLPKLVRDGFSGPVYTSTLSAGIVPIILKDAARIFLQELKEKRKQSKKHPNKIKVLYNEHDVNFAIKLLRAFPLEKSQKIGPFEVIFHQAGHIPGAVSVGVQWEEGNILFSGDLGRFNDSFTHDPVYQKSYDNFVVESTYGGVVHAEQAQAAQDNVLKEIVQKTIENQGTLLIAAFALARSQMLLFHLYEVYKEFGDQRIPIFLDGPMANEITQLMSQFPEEYKGDLKSLAKAFKQLNLIEQHWQTKNLEKTPPPKIIISSSGMLTGGKVMGHLEQLIGSESNILFLPGFQVPGTLGFELAQGLEVVKLSGRTIPVKAQIIQSHLFSAHADENEIARWLKLNKRAPKRIFLVHGEKDKMIKLKEKLSHEFSQTHFEMPELNQSFDL